MLGKTKITQEYSQLCLKRSELHFNHQKIQSKLDSLNSEIADLLEQQRKLDSEMESIDERVDILDAAVLYVDEVEKLIQKHYEDKYKSENVDKIVERGNE